MVVHDIAGYTKCTVALFFCVCYGCSCCCFYANHRTLTRLPPCSLCCYNTYIFLLFSNVCCCFYVGWMLSLCSFKHCFFVVVVAVVLCECREWWWRWYRCVFSLCCCCCCCLFICFSCSVLVSLFFLVLLDRCVFF